jgi:hypothetical protein
METGEFVHATPTLFNAEDPIEPRCFMGPVQDWEEEWHLRKGPIIHHRIGPSPDAKPSYSNWNQCIQSFEPLDWGSKKFEELAAKQYNNNQAFAKIIKEMEKEAEMKRESSFALAEKITKRAEEIYRLFSTCKEALFVRRFGGRGIIFRGPEEVYLIVANNIQEIFDLVELGRILAQGKKSSEEEEHPQKLPQSQSPQGNIKVLKCKKCGKQITSDMSYESFYCGRSCAKRGSRH